MCRAADEVTLLLEPSYSVTCLQTRRYADGENCFKNTTVAGKLEFLVKTCKCFLYRFFIYFQLLFFAFFSISLPPPPPPPPPSLCLTLKFERNHTDCTTKTCCVFLLLKCFCAPRGAGIAQWLEHRTCD